jgi:hypothetical protein
MDILEREFALRLADVKAAMDELTIDPDGNIADIEETGTFLSVLDHALRGDEGCNERDQWDAERREALVQHRTYLGL